MDFTVPMAHSLAAGQVGGEDEKEHLAPNVMDYEERTDQDIEDAIMHARHVLYKY